MNWSTVIWATVATACVTLAVVHGLVWVRRRAAWANLLFAVTAVGTAAMAAGEWWMLHAATPVAYGVALQWFHLPVWITFLGLLGFVRFYLSAGRPWLAWSAAGLRTVSLAINFLQPPNLNYREISALRQIPFLGDSVALPVGQPNPSMLIGQLSLLFLLGFVLDAAVTVRRRGSGRRALTIGGSVTFFVGASMAQAIAVFWGWVEGPITASLFFTGIVMAMGYELSSDLLRSGELVEELRQREGELQQERGLTDAVFNSVPGLIYLYTANGKLVRWNQQYEIRAGYSSAELARMNVMDWFATEDQETVRAAWKEALTGGNVTIEVPVKMKDGRRVPYLLTGVRVCIDDQPHVVGMGIDIAQRKALEEEAVRQHAELAHLARVASLSELSGSLAHELNQPLAIILSNAQAAQRLLAKDPPDLKEVREILEDIVSEDRRAGDVIKRLRALLKRGDVERQPVRIDEVIQEVLALIRGDLVGRGIGVRYQPGDNPPTLFGDRIPLQQVVLNLITNAADAMAANVPAERQLTITEHCDGPVVRVCVSDAGCGLPTEAGRIFEPFFTTKPHGLGMGLSICRTIVSAHGGRLWAEPNDPRGTKFHLELPVAEGIDVLEPATDHG
jgi:PAS domain S-box-containing protein